jgi:DNA-directed RNA polymerase subunit L
MNVEFISKEKDFIEAKLEGADEGLANMVVEKLLGRKTVKYAACSLVHPLIPVPVIRVRAADAKKELIAAIEEVEDGLKATSKSAEKI